MYIKLKNKEKYLVAKKRKQPPVFTSAKDKAANYKNLAICKVMRDDVLEYYPKAVEIVS